MKPRAAPASTEAIALTIEAVAGPSLVLDTELRIVLATPGAAALVGPVLPLFELATKLLCGRAIDRPLAEALAAGRPVDAIIARPGPAGDRLIRVRSLPVGEAASHGWLLLLDDAGPADDRPLEFHGMLTRDPAMKQLFRLIERVADGEAPILVRGETGSGKELVARAVHALSPRRAGPFRAINCAALPSALLESELFGHVRGAFTGAVRDNPGHFQLAHGGTLFLDEVGELPIELQAKLLRVIETQTVLPVGGRDMLTVDVRIVSATHRSLRKEVAEGRFRADLMYRLRVIPVFLPPLRARAGDVRLLTNHWIERLNARGRRQVAQVAPSAWARLEAHDWGGNVRELINVLTYAYAVGEGPVLVPVDLPPELGTPEEAWPGARVNVPSRALEVERSPEVERILRALERARGNRSRAAKILGMSRVTLWRHMKELGMAGDDEG